MVVNERASLKMELSDGMSSHSEEEEDTDIEDIDEDSQSSTNCSNAPTKPTSISLFSNNGHSIFTTLPTPHCFEGLNSGVPTRTTPTLTPTTQRSIEQTFIDFQSANSERHSNEARFVPPSVKPLVNTNQYTPSSSNIDSTNALGSNIISSLPSSILGASVVNATDTPNIYTTTSNMNKSVTQWHHLSQISPPGPSSISQDCNSSDSGSSFGTMSMRPTPPVTPHRQPMMTPTTLDDATNASDASPPPQYSQTSSGTGTGRGRGGARRNVGGRKPQREANLSPEEEQRRQMRRERNKAAAARCRKRRVDHTNMLVEEVEGLENKKRLLHAELQDMRLAKEELEMLLAHHSKDGTVCKADSIHTTRTNPNLNTTSATLTNNLRKHVENMNNALNKPPAYNSNNNVLPITSIKTEEYDEYDMDYNDNDDDDVSSGADDDYVDIHRNLFNTPNNKSVMLTHASLPPVIMQPSRPSSLNVLSNSLQHKTLSTANCDSLAGIINSTPSSGLNPFNFDSMMVGGTGLTPVAGPLLPISLHCSSQQQQFKLNTAMGGVNVATTMAEMMGGDLNTPDISHKHMLSL